MSSASNDKCADLAVESRECAIYIADMLKPRITEFREAKGMTVEVLAAKVGLSHTYISRMANGKRNASLKQLEKIARVLECTVADLIAPPADKLEEVVLAAWAAIPQGRREDAMRMLRSLGDVDAKERNLESVESGSEQVERPTNAPKSSMSPLQKEDRRSEKP